MPTESQLHPLRDGSSIEIFVNGLHQYWTEHDQVKRPSVSALTGHVDRDAFGAGQGYAIKQMNLGLDPRKSTKDAAEEGSKLHKDIDNFIKSDKKIIAEENNLFVKWHQELGDKEWITTERYVFNPELLYGGTLDAIGITATSSQLYDWKTVNPDSWHKYGSDLRKAKDSAQIAGYALALESMGSAFDVDQAFIAYILRDGSGVELEKVDLDWGRELFLGSRYLYNKLKEGGQDESKD